MPLISDHIDNAPSLADALTKKVDSRATKLITNAAFVPEIGRCYEVHFGKVTTGNQTEDWFARIRPKGLQPSEWIDLDTGEVLDSSFRAYVVQKFREIDCPAQISGTEA